MTDTPWTPLKPDAPFPDRMQGRWMDEASDEVGLVVDGRRLTYGGRDLPIGELSLLDDDGALAVQNAGPDSADGLGWAQQTMHILWFNPDEDVLNYHGPGDHGWVVREITHD